MRYWKSQDNKEGDTNDNPGYVHSNIEIDKTINDGMKGSLPEDPVSGIIVDSGHANYSTDVYLRFDANSPGQENKSFNQHTIYKREHQFQEDSYILFNSKFRIDEEGRKHYEMDEQSKSFDSPKDRKTEIIFDEKAKTATMLKTTDDFKNF